MRSSPTGLRFPSAKDYEQDVAIEVMNLTFRCGDVANDFAGPCLGSLHHLWSVEQQCLQWVLVVSFSKYMILCDASKLPSMVD